MANIHITQIEKAINFWRSKDPATESSGCTVCAEVNALASVYGLMIANRATEIAQEEFSPMQTAAFDACFQLSLEEAVALTDDDAGPEEHMRA